MKSVSHLLVLALALTAGCATSYSWKPRVPSAMRSVCVPSFQNESNLMEIGALATRQVAREFQREGTFKLASSEDAAIEIQGIVKSVSIGSVGYNRRTFSRYTGSELRMMATVSVVDKREGKVLVDNKTYTAQTTTVVGQDATTAQRDASGRLADDLARQVVDDVLNLKW